MPPRSVNIRWRKELPPNQVNLNVLCCVIVSGLSLQNVTEHNHSSDFSSENMMNMTKGLYSTKKKKRVPEELWMEICDIVTYEVGKNMSLVKTRGKLNYMS